MHFRRSARIFAASAVASMVALTAPSALAHDSVIGGNVVSDAPLEEFPQEITLEFSAVPKEGFNTFAVTNTETGAVLFDAEPSLNDRELTVEVPQDVKPGPGEYQVGFQITSSDGHATRGSVPFTVAGGAGSNEVAESSDAADAADAADPSGLPSAAKWALAAVALFAVVAAVIMAGAKMRRSNDLNS